MNQGKEATMPLWKKAIRQAAEDGAKETGLEIARVYLFGSRARGNADTKSDWDVLVVVRGELNRDQRRDLFVRINRRLAEAHIPADILIRTEIQLGRALKRFHSIEKIVLAEGVPL